MKVKKLLRNKKRYGRSGRTQGSSLKGIATFVLSTFLCLILLLVPKVREEVRERRVYAASESGKGASGASLAQGSTYPMGIAGVVLGLQSSLPGMKVNRIGMSCEQLMVGQRARTIESGPGEWDMGEYVESTVDEMNSAVYTLASAPRMMSDTDYETLLRIVEAESGGEDIKGRVLVANVILNRVKHEEFPDTVTEVVWENHNGVTQFSPTYDGRISEVVVSDETREAVNQALNGVDYSQGALFFVEKSAAEKDSLRWFEKDLKKLFKHGVHDFYTYPDEGEELQAENQEEDDSQTVEMVKAEF